MTDCRNCGQDTSPPDGRLPDGPGQHTAEPGSICSGTLRTEDLVNAFVDALDRLKAAESLSPWWNPDRFARLDDLLAEVERERTEHGYYHGDLCADHLERMQDALNGYAPDGHFFGAHPGDGADFGFWPCDEDDPQPMDPQPEPTDTPADPVVRLDMLDQFGKLRDMQARAETESRKLAMSLLLEWLWPEAFSAGKIRTRILPDAPDRFASATFLIYSKDKPSHRSEVPLSIVPWPLLADVALHNAGIFGNPLDNAAGQTRFQRMRQWWLHHATTEAWQITQKTQHHALMLSEWGVPSRRPRPVAQADQKEIDAP